MDKFEHVRQVKQTRSHSCHWKGCNRQVPPALWGCKRHWYKLPHFLRTKIWAVYVPGQERTLTPSPEYLKVAHEVDTWVERYEEAMDL